MSPRATVVITTRNRRDELEKAVASALAQKLEGGLEIVVIDDGSTDGTAESIAEKFPGVKLHRFGTSAGLIVRRNYGARVASAPILFSIDDDACFSTEKIVATIVDQFDHPAIGAVAIPFIDVCKDAHLVRQKAPDSPGEFICPSFIGTAHALRRDLFLQLGGYRESLFHQGEEGDYCLRMLAAGHVVRLGRSDPIHHYESLRRDFRRMDLYGRRNNVLFGWHYVPASVLPAYFAATTWNGLRHGIAMRRPWVMMEGLAQGYRAIWRERKQRTPVSPAIFELYRDLVRRQAVPLEEIAARLPAPGSARGGKKSQPSSRRPADAGIIVAQLGARMHYAVPRLLEKEGRLEMLYTDICARKGWPRLLALWPRAWRPGFVQRLLGRAPEGVPSRRITAFTGFGLDYARRLAQARSTDERNAAFLWSGRDFCRRVVARGFGEAKAIYVFNSAGLEILQATRRAGVKGVVEQTIAPHAMERMILKDEAERFSGWEPPVEESSLTDDYCAREAAEWNAADLVVCGSDFVRDGIAACGGDRQKCVVVPYGLAQNSMAPIRAPRRPGSLRVLTVGAVCLRKGAPYVLAAADKMAGRAQFRIAGAIQVLPWAERQLRAKVELTGTVPRSKIAAQYAWADVLLLPSLCEGSATATYEALSRGVPVICTRETGSIVCEGEDGFIVGSRDSDAIADRLTRLADDPDLLAAMSVKAHRRGAEYTLEKYGERLFAAFRARGIIES